MLLLKERNGVILIVNQPPAFASPAHFSPELCLFISACLQKDPKNRLSANGLMLGTLVQRNSGPISRFYERRHNFHCCLLNLTQHSSLAIDDILWFLNRGLSEEIK